MSQTSAWVLGSVITAVIVIAAALARLTSKRLDELDQRLTELEEEEKLRQLINTPAASGDGLAALRPVRLRVIEGGAMAAVLASLGAGMRHLWQHRPQVTMAALAASTATAITVYATVWAGPAEGEGPAAPEPTSNSWPEPELTPAGLEPSEPAPSEGGGTTSRSPEPSAPTPSAEAPHSASPHKPDARPAHTRGGVAKDTSRPGQETQQPRQAPPATSRPGNGNGRGSGNGNGNGRGNGQPKLSPSPQRAACTTAEVPPVGAVQACVSLS